MKQRIVLLGPPASGKGSQARMINEKYGIPSVSTGHLMREEAASGSLLGKHAAQFTSKGQFAPDELVMKVLQGWLGNGRRAFILDGFPRTIGQAESLESLLDELFAPLEIAVMLDCSLGTIEERVLNRVSCSNCGEIYKIGLHLSSGAVPCPKCGGKLVRRSDDTATVLAQRIVQHAEKTEPLIEFYKSRGLLSRIEADPAVPTVFAAIEAALKS